MSLFTGRFPKAHGIRTNQPVEGARFTKDLTQVFREAGYHIALIGRPGVGLLTPGAPGSAVKPEDHCISGYGHSLGYPRKGRERIDKHFNMWMARLNHWISIEPTPFPVDCQYPMRIAEDCIVYLREYVKEPFFLRFACGEPHSPYQVPIPYWNMFPPDKMPERIAGPEALKNKGFPWDWELKLIRRYHPEYDPEDETIWRRLRSNYSGMIRLINDAISKILEFLNSSGLSERAHIVFLADHGDYQGDFGLLRKGVGVPESLMRVPLTWKGPGISEAKVVDDCLVSLVDVMPTMCELAGVKVPLGVQGRSFASILQDKPGSKEEFGAIYGEQGTGYRRVRRVDFNHRTCVVRSRAGGRDTFQELNIVTQSGSIRMLRKGNWKLIFDWEKAPELCNISEDAGEMENLFGDPQYRELGLEMLQDLFRWTVKTEEMFPWPIIYFDEWPEYLRTH